MKSIYVQPPSLQNSNIKEYVSCIRGHRERIFNVSYETIKSQTIFHNYGHGGAGWTFLFGCVNASIAQFEEAVATQPSIKKNLITVLGGGCYGLLTAATLAHKGYNVQIIAKDLTDIPSQKAAGFFFPRPRKVSNAHETEIFLSYGMESYHSYQSIINGNHPFIPQGPRIVPAYFGLDLDPGFTPYVDVGLIDEAKKVRIDFGTATHEAIQYQLIYINPPAIMDELGTAVNRFKIPIIEQAINSFAEINTPIIFNCTGRGATQLIDDPKMVPVQGHLITLQHQPNIEALQYMLNFKVIQKGPKGDRYELIYFAPRDEGILGVTFLRGPQAVNPNLHEFDRLLERSRIFFGE